MDIRNEVRKLTRKTFFLTSFDEIFNLFLISDWPLPYYWHDVDMLTCHYCIHSISIFGYSVSKQSKSFIFDLFLFEPPYCSRVYSLSYKPRDTIWYYKRIKKKLFYRYIFNEKYSEKDEFVFFFFFFSYYTLPCELIFNISLIAMTILFLSLSLSRIYQRKIGLVLCFMLFGSISRFFLFVNGFWQKLNFEKWSRLKNHVPAYWRKKGWRVFSFN